MADSFNVWPNGVPTTYSGEPFPWPTQQSFPALYGIDVTNPFFLSFLLGGAFVAVFSVARFNMRSHDPSDPVTAESRLLQELTPLDMRDPRMMLQSYILYVCVLLGMYTALTFYGRLILDWVNTVLPVAGFATDTSTFDFASPQWPLFVALGMIGVLPVLKPVEAVEIRLRRWTHRAVGIPLTIYRHAEVMRGVLRGMKGGKPGAGPVYAKDPPPWLREAVSDWPGVQDSFEAREQLDDLVRWVKYGRGEWPSGETDRPIERLFDQQVAHARDALLNFEDFVEKKNGSMPVRVNNLPQDVTAAEHRARHLSNLRDDWQKKSSAIVDARDSMLALLAVAAEKQTDYSKIESPELKCFLSKAIPASSIQKGPQVGVALLLPLIFFAYALAIYFGYHFPITGSNDGGISTVIFSAVYEVLQVCVIFLFPLMAAMSYRYWSRSAYRGRWMPLRRLNFAQRCMVQVLCAGLLALFVSALGLGLLAVAQAGIVARGTSHFRSLLLDANLPLLPVSLSLAGVSVIYCLFVLFAVEEKQQKHPGARDGFLGLGLLCALLTLSYVILHTYFWYFHNVKPTAGATAYNSCTGNFLFFADLFYPADWPAGKGWQGCSQYYNLTSYIIYSLIAFLSVASFLPDRQPTPTGGEAADAAPDPASPPARGAGAQAGATLAAVALVAGTLLAVTSGVAHGQAASMEDPTGEVVVVGVRADAPPFSYLQRIGEHEHYAGYIVDLCTKIFAGDRQKEYRMVTTEVTAQDRFLRLVRQPAERWQPGMPLRGAKVDLLCDPVTLRYSSENDDPPDAPRTDGIFSPIIYVTGVSYLERSRGALGTPVLAYVVGTTARRVAQQACERDAFRQRPNPGDAPDSVAIERCRKDVALAERAFTVESPGQTGRAAHTCRGAATTLASATAPTSSASSRTTPIWPAGSAGARSRRRGTISATRI